MTFARAFAPLGALATTLFLLLACGETPQEGDGDEDGTGGAGVCVSGSTQLCSGPGACQGAAVCLADGSGYGPCDCGGAGGTTASGGSGASGTSGTGQGGASGSSASGGSSGTPGRVVKSCVPGCTTVADCVAPVAWDTPDHYYCVDGGCVRRGCLGDAECNAQLAGNVCGPYPGLPVNQCTRPCTGPEVCGDTTGSSQTTGPDNWSCTDGACAYQGCNTDAECQADNASYPQAANAFCARTGASPACNFTCGTAADCVLNASIPYVDEDNYVCESGVCTWLGCLSDAECPVTYVCRSLVFAP